jgi:hypothetical protein
MPRSLAGLAWLLAAFAAVCAAPGCSLGEGTGSCSGSLDEPTCWVGSYDMHPDFFAAIPTTNVAGTPIAMNALQIRIQHGGDYSTFSDGLAIVIDDLADVLGGSGRPSMLGQALTVSLPPGVVPPGVPVEATASPSVVHATLYLGQTCRTQNIALYAVSAVSGPCGQPVGGDPPLVCGSGSRAANACASVDSGAGAGADSGADADADAGAGAGATAEAGASDAAAASSTLGPSTITFNSLFDGDPNESSAAARLTDATFHFYLADPREICPGGLGPPPRCRGELTGSFHFYFERGKPAQPFP